MPSRCAIQSGRAPIHVNVENVLPEVRNHRDPLAGYQGIPLNITTVAEPLRAQGWLTHFVGKWFQLPLQLTYKKTAVSSYSSHALLHMQMCNECVRKWHYFLLCIGARRRTIEKLQSNMFSYYYLYNV